MLLWPILFAILPFLGTLARWSAPPEALSEASATIPIGADIDFTDVGGEAGRYTFAAGPLLWTGIGVALAVLRCAHMCYSYVKFSGFLVCLGLTDKWTCYRSSLCLGLIQSLLKTLHHRRRHSEPLSVSHRPLHASRALALPPSSGKF